MINVFVLGETSLPIADSFSVISWCAACYAMLRGKGGREETTGKSHVETPECTRNFGKAIFC